MTTATKAEKKPRKAKAAASEDGKKKTSAKETRSRGASYNRFKEFEGRRLPQRWLVRHAEAPFAELVVETWNVNVGKPSDAPQDGAN